MRKRKQERKEEENLSFGMRRPIKERRKSWMRMEIGRRPCDEKERGNA